MTPFNLYELELYVEKAKNMLTEEELTKQVKTVKIDVALGYFTQHIPKGYWIVSLYTETNGTWVCRYCKE